MDCDCDEDIIHPVLWVNKKAFGFWCRVCGGIIVSAVKRWDRKEKKMKLKSGEVVIDRFNSHLHGSVAPHLPAALARIHSGGRNFLVEEVDFGQPIGETICVPTGPGDEIVYAKRLKRLGYTRFVKNRTPEPCSSVVMILKTADGQADAGKYVLVTAFVGQRPEPEPWDRNANGNSLAFWNSHALVWGCEPIVPGTETTRCPW